MTVKHKVLHRYTGSRMSNPFNGSKLGKPGGRFRPSRLKVTARERDDRPTALRKAFPLYPSVPVDSIRTVEATLIKMDQCELEESTETHIVPRKSVTKRQGLMVQPQTLEFEPLADTKVITYQADKMTGQTVEVTDYYPRNRIVWKSDKTLLRRGLPDQLQDIRFKRLTSRSKRVVTELELLVTMDAPVTNIPSLDLRK